MTEETAATRVARGAAYMDEKYPGWERRIDTGTLSLEPTSTTCIVAQGSGVGLVEGFMAAVEYGQTINDGEVGGTGLLGFVGHGNEDELRDLWVALIKSRFDTGCLSDEVDG